MVSTDHLPEGTITFVFTDIEGSTRLLQQLGDAFPAVLERHHRLLRDSFASEGGVEVMTEGDSFFVVFTSAPAAIRAAVAAQRALASHDWPEGVAVKVRMGLHTGEGLKVGDNYGGLDVHRAARISAAGHGGQILVSGTTRALVEATLPGDTTLIDLGEHRLKDIELPERLFQISIEGLPQSFPPPRTVDARPNNLPVSLTTFIGREREVGAIAKLVEECRLVTLTGPGGTGKTRLSIEVGRELLPRFRDGVFLVLLAAVTDPALVASEIADAVGIREEKEAPILETLKRELADRELLLVLDNFEQIVDAAPILSELLHGAPKLKCLVSSRIVLQTYGEQEYPVPPMSVPDPTRVADPAALEGYEAVALFVQRAKAVRPDFALTADNAAAVAGICEYLDGLPLAIELVASRVRLLGAAEILQRMKDGALGVAKGARDLPERQRTLRGAIAWSYDLLDDPLKALFCRLSVFRGGCSFAAADSICNRDEELDIDTLDGLSALIENSLIRRTEDAAGDARFRMLQTIREYGMELLESASDCQDIFLRHALYMLDVAREAEANLTKGQGWVERLSMDHDNLRAAMRWSLDHGRADIGLGIAAAVWRFWQFQGHLTEGRRWLSELLAAPECRDRTELRAKGLMAIGSVTYWQNDFDATRIFYEEGLGIFRELGDDRGVAEALYNVAFVDLIDGRHDSAREGYAESRLVHQRLSDPLGVGWATWGLGMTALISGDLDAARELGEETARRFRELGNWYGEGLGDFVVSEVERRRGNYDEVERRLTALAHRSEQFQDILGFATTFELMGDIELRRGRPRRGLVLAGVSSALKDAAGGGAPRELVVVPDLRDEARGLLPQDEIAARFEEGRALSLDEGLAFLRKEPEPE